jgi:hypothetical protein
LHPLHEIESIDALVSPIGSVKTGKRKYMKILFSIEAKNMRKTNASEIHLSST